MRNKGIWIVILLILSAGIGCTVYTRSYVKERQTEAAGEMPVQQSNAGTLPGTSGQAAEGILSAAKAAESGSYPARLNELDRELKDSREKDKGYSAKARMENELALWQYEVDLMMDTLEEHLDGEDREFLLQHQQEWLRDRESQAVSDSARQSSAALEELEYIRSQAEATRSRAYELYETYADLLQ